MNYHDPQYLLSDIALDAQRAWLFWQKITNLADWLWDEYEQQFLALCIEESNRSPTSPAAFH